MEEGGEGGIEDRETERGYSGGRLICSGDRFGRVNTTTMAGGRVFRYSARGARELRSSFCPA